MNWGFALAQGVGAAAKSASGLLEDSMKEDTRIAAEDRAANRQLAMEERLVGIREAAAARAEERKLATNRAQGQAITTRAKGLLEEGEQSVMSKVNSDPNAAPMTQDEIDGMPPETRKLYDLPDKGELADLKREAKAAMEMGDAARAKEINDRIKDIESVGRAKDKDAADERRHQERLSHDEKLARIRASDGGNKATANMKDIDDIAKTLFGGDRAKAYEYVAANQGKARSQVVRDMLQVVNNDTAMGTASSDEKLAAAEKLADRLIAGDISKASVRGGTAPAAAQTPPANRPPLQSFFKGQ